MNSRILSPESDREKNGIKSLEKEEKEDNMDEEESLTERDLAEDAQWKQIQQNTFTRWVNEHLKTVGLRLDNLETDLSDGLLLIRLLEVLAGKKLPRHTKRPNLRMQKLENVSVALKFLEDDEGVKLVNIDSSDIVDQRLKLILGLIWMLILHYAISMPVWEDDESRKMEKASDVRETPKQRLMGWVRQKLPPDVPVTNFTSDWNDGIALGALVDAVAPGLNPDWRDWKPKNAETNTEEAMDLARDYLDVPKLIEPHEMINPNVDELSIMTYLAQYPSGKVKEDAPLRKRGQPKVAKISLKAEGRGLERAMVGQEAGFRLQTSDQKLCDNLTVALVAQNGKQEPINCDFDEQTGSYACSYTPTDSGPHQVVIECAGKAMSGSPFTVIIDKKMTDPTKIKVHGPGLDEGNLAGKQTYFTVDFTEAGEGRLDVVIVDSEGNQEKIVPEIAKIDANTFRVTYTPSDVGLHSVNVFYDRKAIPNSPFGVRVVPVASPSKVKVWGRGVVEKGIRVGDFVDFKVSTEEAGEGKLDVQITGPYNEQIPIESSDMTEESNVREFRYRPETVGGHTVRVLYAKEDCPKSPFQVDVAAPTDCPVKAFGPGLESGMCNLPANFLVETNGATGPLGFVIEGPSKAQITCRDQQDGTAEVEYLPTAPGIYEVHILSGEEDIDQSPFLVKIDPFQADIHPSLVRCTGTGLEPGCVKRDQPAQFSVEAKGAAGLKREIPRVWALDKDMNAVPVQMLDNGDETFACRYVPERVGKHYINVAYAGIGVPGSPFKVKVEEPIDPSKVKLQGPGIDQPVRSLQQTHFIIDAKQAGPGEVEVQLSDATSGNAVDIDVLDNNDGSFTVKYTAPKPGRYQLRVVFAGREIPDSPIEINVQPHLDVAGVRVEGLDNTVFVGSEVAFVINAQGTGKSSAFFDQNNQSLLISGKSSQVPQTSPCRVSCHLSTPQHSQPNSFIPLEVVDRQDDTYSAAFIPQQEGEHQIAIYYENLEVAPHPIRVGAVHGCDPSRCRASGPGLGSGIVDKPCEFYVDTKKAGEGGLSLEIFGPSESKSHIKDHSDGSCTVEYVPAMPGPYDIGIKFADTHIPGSPFRALVDYEVDATKVNLSGDGLSGEKIREGILVKFRVDASQSGRAPLNVQIRTDQGPAIADPQVREIEDKIYEVTYMPPNAGVNIDFDMKYGDQTIASPKSVSVLPKVEANKVQIVAEDGAAPIADVPASIPVYLSVNTSEAGQADLDVSVLGPDGADFPVNVSEKEEPGNYTVQFTPEETGVYELLARYGTDPVTSQPLKIRAYPVGDASQCFISERPASTVAVNEESCITVNTASAGDPGRLTARVTPVRDGAQSLPLDIHDNLDGTYTVHMKPLLIEPHRVKLFYGGRPVPDGQWTQQVDLKEYIRLRERDFDTTSPGLPPAEYWDLDLGPDLDIRQLDATVIMPTKRPDAPTIHENHDGTLTVMYQPKQTGLHEMHIKHEGVHVQGSPFNFHVDAISDGYVSAYGAGLSYGIAGEPACFTVCAQEAGSGHTILGHGGLSVAIEGPAKAEIKCHDNKDGTCAVTWVPPAPGEYSVHVKFGNKEIKNSPFVAKVAGEGRKRAHLSVGSTSEVSLPINGDIKGLSASIKSPGGIEEPCFIRRIDSDKIGVSFTPREIGEHLVSVKKKGNMLRNAPFRIKVGPEEVGNADKVKVSGPGIAQAVTQQFNDVIVNTTGAGFGGLSVSLEGPSKAELKCQENKDGTITLGYKPTEPGIYVLSVKFADNHVPDSPFTVKCVGQGVGSVLEKITKKQSQPTVVQAGQDCEVYLKIPHTSALDMNAKLMNPEGISEDIEIRDMGDNYYQVRFSPQMDGLHTISVMNKEQHASGSPFQFTVGPFKEGGAHKVRAGGPGLLRGEVNEKHAINVYTREAGAGTLSIAIEGPSKAELDFQDHKDGNCHVMYTVPKTGEYMIGIKFNDQHIPDSPFKVEL